MNGTLSAPGTLVLPKITNVNSTDDTLVADLEDGRTISVPIGWYPRLAHGTPQESASWELSGAGYGIYWQDPDEDLGVEGILLGKKSNESASSFACWLEQRKSGYGIISEPHE